MVNDRQVCDDMEQLRFTRDFSFLDEFYGVGENSSPEPVDLSKLDTPELALIEIEVADLEDIEFGERTEMKTKTVKPLQVPPLKLTLAGQHLGVKSLGNSFRLLCCRSAVDVCSVPNLAASCIPIEKCRWVPGRAGPEWRPLASDQPSFGVKRGRIRRLGRLFVEEFCQQLSK
jgi:hypothetical protein